MTENQILGRYRVNPFESGLLWNLFGVMFAIVLIVVGLFVVYRELVLGEVDVFSLVRIGFLGGFAVILFLWLPLNLRRLVSQDSRQVVVTGNSIHIPFLGESFSGKLKQSAIPLADVSSIRITPSRERGRRTPETATVEITRMDGIVGFVRGVREYEGLRRLLGTLVGGGRLQLV